MGEHGRMSDAGFWDALAGELRAAGLGAGIRRAQAVGGGCIHRAERVEMEDGRRLLVKRNDAACAPMFAAEAEGLAELARPRALRVPRALAHGTAAAEAYLALEYLELTDGPGDPPAFGRALARLHATTAEAFGWHRDNYIGETPQPNGWCDDWTRFWRECRLGHQLALAERDGHRSLAARGRRLLEQLDALLDGHRPVPSLLHGDLWAGNHGYGHDGVAAIFDPAVYYGDREAELAMTELFGGFPRAFYRAYAETWPLGDGYPVRARLYNLYHVLNHAHLFGGGYAGQAARMIDALLAEAGA